MNQYSCRKVLVPVDLSEASLNALETAAAIAKSQKATLYILHVDEDRFDFSKDDAFYHSDQSLDVLSALANAILHKAEIKPEVLNEKGAVVSCILKKCFEHSCDLVVMGAHGASGFRDGFIGSNTYAVIKYAPCPVLTVPAQKKWTAFKRVLFPIRPVIGALARYDVVRTFLSPQSALNILGLSQRRQERDVSVLEELSMEIGNRIREDKVLAKTSWGSGGNLPDDVLNYSLQNNSDLVVVTSTLDVTNKPHFIGPNVQKIINGAKMPVLCIRKTGAWSEGRSRESLVRSPEIGRL